MAQSEITRVFSKGDRLRSLRALLVGADGDAIDLSTAATPTVGVMFRLIQSSDGATKVNNSTQGIVVVTASSGEVRYDWQTTSIDTPGDFYAWFIRYATTSTGHTEHFPSGRTLKIRILGDT